MYELDTVPRFLFFHNSFPLWTVVTKSTFALMISLLSCQFLGRQSAAIRHRVLACGLAASLVIPIVSVVLPQLTVQVLPSFTDASLLLAEHRSIAATSTHAAKSIIPGPAGELAESTQRALDTNSTTTGSAESPSDRHLSSEAPTSMHQRSRIGQTYAFVWLIGTVIGSILFFTSVVVQSNRLRRLKQINDVDWVHSVNKAAELLRLRGNIITLESPDASVPAVVGVRNPRLVVPANWRTWSNPQRDCILLHELAHVKRGDTLTQFMGRLALIAYWFNPLVWQTVRQLRAERELAADDCVLLAGQPASDYAEQLLRTLQSCRVVRIATGVAMAKSARLDQRIVAILDPQRQRMPVSNRVALAVTCIASVICATLGGLTLTTRAAMANPSDETKIAKTQQGSTRATWKENFTVEYPGTLPVSLAFSADGATLISGDSAGEVMALIFAEDEPQWRWKSKADGSHAAVSYSADQKKVYVTTEHGVRILDAEFGKDEGFIEQKDSNPTAIGVFPDKIIAGNVTQSKIIFGNPQSYFVKTWAQGNLPESLGTIHTSTATKDESANKATTVPLAVDPHGRSAIMTGPVDATGKVGGVEGNNILWASVCGDYDQGSPGNRVMVGHASTVVSAAWAKGGDIAVTGDSAGHVVIWDAKTMKETHRLELGGRIAALAISDDATRTAAYVLGKSGEVYLWETAKPVDTSYVIHNEPSDFGDLSSFACLSFSSDGRQLAGCAGDKMWKSDRNRLFGKLRVWELSVEPKEQPAPKLAYTKQLVKQPLQRRNKKNFTILNNHSLLIPAAKTGAIDFVSLDDGGIQSRIVLGNFDIQGLRLSSDRKWLALEQHPITEEPGVAPGKQVAIGTFDVAVYDLTSFKDNVTIPMCHDLLDIASGGTVVAVIRGGDFQGTDIEVWDIAIPNKRTTAPFKHSRIDAARFSLDGKLLALSDQNTLFLWRWEENTFERIDLGRCVGSLTFSPNGKFLAEGPTSREDVQIRDLETRKVVQTMNNGTGRSMIVPPMVYTQGGRVLIGCDTGLFIKDITVPYRINIWDTLDGSIAHQIPTGDAIPVTIEVSPNGRHLVALLEIDDGQQLVGWRLDGKAPRKEIQQKAPASGK